MVSVRPLEQGDFFAWYELYAGYADFYETPLPDARAMRAWAWLHGTEAAHWGLVAVDDAGKLVGLAHVREFRRLLENDKGLYLEDLFVASDQRGKGVARALIDHIKSEGRDGGFGVVRWMTDKNNATARALYDKVSDKTDWVTYDISLG